MMTFKNPDDFLSYLQRTQSRGIFNAERDEAMLRSVSDDFDMLKMPGGALGNPGTNLSRLVEALKKEAIIGLKPTEQDAIEKMVAIGMLDYGEINAAILRSQDHKYAIVMNSGFMIGLNKYLKLVNARFQPDQVSYCNRKDATLLKPEDLNTYLSEFIDHYRQTSIPLGPRLRLKSDAQMRVAFALHCAELFALCHELGHFFNGDLNDDSRFRKFSELADLYAENEFHEIEYAADRKGFEIYLSSSNASSDSEKIVGLLGVVGLFDFIFMITGAATSSTHPAPLERGLRLARTFFGSDIESILRKSYDDPKVLLALYQKE